MSQPAEDPELSENKPGNTLDKVAKKQGQKRKDKQRAKKQGTYGLTKAEDKESHPPVAQAQKSPRRPSKPDVLQTMPGASKLTATPTADSMPRPSGTSLQDHSSITVPPNATWDEVCQFVFNSSILSGSFEDIKFLACSRRSQTLPRAGGVRALHANSTLVRKTLTSGHLLLDTAVLPDVLEDADLRDIDLAFQAGRHDYCEDSDLEDGDIATESKCEPEEQSDDKDDIVEQPAVDGAKGSDADSVMSPALKCDPNSSTEDGLKGGIQTTEAGTHEDQDEVSVLQTKVGATAPSRDYSSPAPVGEDKAEVPTEDPPNSKATGGVQAEGFKAPVRQLSKANNAERGDSSLRSGTRTVLVTDTAFQTLRTFIFFAYTGRVAFAPLRSQGMIYQDSGKDATQLPVCSPKSMYRLAVKYGNETLGMQAAIDIQSKLSTRNILEELFSQFSCRYPDIQDMELNFLLAHMKHPDIIIRLPWWIDRFARGELVACADTFGKLIHKLACIASAPPNQAQSVDPKTCPRGCWMPTMRTHSRCDTCGYVMTS